MRFGDERPYERVYNRYDFSYDSVGIGRVFASASPDLTIYMGAFDANYAWNTDKMKADAYAAGVVSILSAFAGLNKGRLVYLSSQQVYDGVYAAPVGEEEPLSPKNPSALALAHGEDICRSYTRSADVMVLRLDNVYHVPQTADDCTDAIASLCRQGLMEGFVTVSQEKEFSLLAEGDAVQFVLNAATAESHAHTVYNISSGDKVSEADLAQKISDASDPHFRIVPMGADRAEKYAVVLDAARYREEFGINRLLPMDDGIKRTADRICGNTGVFLQEKEEKTVRRSRVSGKFRTFFQSTVPFILSTVAFALIFLLNGSAAGSRYFSRIDFYFIFVLMAALVYGQQLAIYSAILATAGYFIQQMTIRSGFEIMIDLNTYVWIAELFILGPAVGYLRDKLTDQRMEAQEDHSYMEGQLQDVTDINDTNVRIKDSLQTQILNEDNSIGKIFSITSELNRYSEDEVLFYAAGVLEKLTGSEDVAIYQVSGDTYARLSTATSVKARMLGTSIRYRELGELSDCISSGKVFINRKLDTSLPMMTSVIYEAEQPHFLLMIFTLPWEKLTLGEANLLSVAGALIQNSLLHSERYLEAVRDSRYIDGTPVMKWEAYRELLGVYQRASAKSLTSFRLLQFDKPASEILGESNSLTSRLRSSDYVGADNEGRVFLLLTNTEDKGAEIVSERLASKGFPCSVVPDSVVKDMIEDLDKEAPVAS